MADNSVMTRERIRTEVTAQVAEEQVVVWRVELEQDAKLKDKRLDHDREAPEPYAVWLNMAPEKPKPVPGVGEMLTYEFRNELGDAELLQKFQEGQYVFDHKTGIWMEFSGVVWEPDAVGNIKRVVMTTLPEMYEHGAGNLGNEIAEEQAKMEKRLWETDEAILMADQEEDNDAKDALKEKRVKIQSDFNAFKKSKSDKRKSLFKRAHELRGSRRVNKVLEVTSSGKGTLGISGKDWEKHENLFAVANGVVDLETGKLMRSSPGLYLQHASPYPYLGLWTVSDWWDDHLRKVFCCNDFLIDYFEWAIGYSITGMRVNKDIWIAHGPHADNGKSATFNTIKGVIGGYADTIKTELLLDDGKLSKGPDPDLMVIDGLRMGIASEAGDKAKFSVERIKAITGGDDVRARALYADSKVIKSMVKLWLHTNAIPNFSGYDPGFSLRLKVIPFQARFTHKEDEVNEAKNVFKALDQHAFKEMQKREAPGILAWVLRCGRKFLLNPGMRPPEIVMQHTRGYFDDQDVIGKFITARCIESPDIETQAKNLYNAFRKYCMDELGIIEKHVKSLRSFGQDFALRYEKRESNKVYYKGIGLLAEGEFRTVSGIGSGGDVCPDD